MRGNRPSFFQVVVLCIFLATADFGCGGGASTSPSLPPAAAPAALRVAVSPADAAVQAAATISLSAMVSNDPADRGVTWAVSCPAASCGAISSSATSSGVALTYTAPTTFPSGGVTIAVTATSVTDPSISASAALIPVGHIAGYDAGVDYHAFGDSLDTSAFINAYDQPQVRQTVQSQLQGMADRGATLIHTRIWMVNDPGDSFDIGLSYREFFPLSDQQAANLRTYAQDVAAVLGASGNRLRLDICMLWLGAADYTIGSPTTGLGYSKNTSAADYTTRVATTTDKLLAAVSDIMRPDGIRLVDTIYLDGTENIGVVPNQDWFMTSQYPRFFSVVSAKGIRPAVYFVMDGNQTNVFDNSYVDPNDPILNGHRSVVGIYRSLKFMVAQKLPLPSRVDFALYMVSTGATYDQILQRGLDDADATLPSLGAPKLYGVAETDYLADPTKRLQYAQAYPTQAALNSRLQWVCFWTTPSAYPFAIEDYLAPP
jgi:hypothetical protein